MSLLDRITAHSDLQNRLLLQNDRIGQMAHQPSSALPKPLSYIDEELLREYNQQFPVGQKYKSPEYEPELEEPVLEPLADPSLENEEDVRHFYDAVSKDLSVLRRELAHLEFEKKDFKRKVDEGFNTGIYHQPSKNLGQIEKEITEVKKKIEQLTTALTDVNNLKEQNRLIILANEGRKQETRKRNKEVIEKYKDAIHILNNGQFSTHQQANETEEQYLERLRRNAETEVVDMKLQDSKALTMKRFREKLKELIRNPSIIDQVANQIDNSFDTITNRFELLKKWPDVSRRFIKLYGQNNSHITADDILFFFREYLGNMMPDEEEDYDLSIISKTTKTAPLYSSGRTDTSSYITASKKISYKVDTDTNTFLMLNNQTQKELYLKIGDLNGLNQVLYSYTGEERSYQGILGETQFKQINQETGITKPDFKKIFSSESPSGILEGVFRSGIIPETKGTFHRDTLRVGKHRRATEQLGYGLREEQIPEEVPFGNVLLYLKKLHLHNILAVKHHNKINIAGFKNTKVSDKFVDIIMKLVQGVYPTHSQLHGLSHNEKLLYDRLVVLAKLHKEVPNTHDKTITDLKKRLDLLHGEQDIGNNNPEIRKEIYYILHALKDFKCLSLGQVRKYLKEN